MEVDRLVATARLEGGAGVIREAGRIDKALDEAAEDRTATITVVEKGSLGKTVRGNGRPTETERVTPGVQADLDRGRGGGGGGGGREPPRLDKGRDAPGWFGKFWDDVTKSIVKAFGAMAIFRTAIGGVKAAFAGIQQVQKFALIASGATAAAGAVAALASALGPLSGLLATIPAGIGAIAAAALAVVPALMGFMKGLQALSQFQQAQKQAATQAADNNYAYAQSLRAVSEAQEEVARAQKDLVQARKDAAEDIEDAQLSAERAQLSEERAILSLQQAYKRLEEVQTGIADKTNDISTVTDDFTGKQFEVVRITKDAADEQADLQDALLAVKEAELAVREAKEQNGDEQERLAELQRKGIEGSDRVVAAQERLADALQGVADAQHGVAQAAKAMAGPKMAEEFNKMSPAAKRVAQLLMDLKPRWEEFVRATQEPLFLGIESGIKQALPHLDTLQAGLVPISAAFGEMASQFGGLFAEFASSGDMTEFLDQTRGYIEDITPGILDFIRGFKDIAIAAEPLMTFLLEGFSKLGEAFADWAAKFREDDSASFFQDTIDVLKQLWEIISNVGHGLGNIFDAARPLGEWLMEMFVGLSQEFSDWSDKASDSGQLRAFFDSLKAPIESFIELIREGINMFFRLFAEPEDMDKLVGLFDWLRESVLPIVEQLIGFATEGGIYDFFFNLSSLKWEAFGKLGEFAESGYNWLSDLWAKIAEFKESESFKNFIDGVHEFVDFIKDEVIPRISEWWDELDRTGFLDAVRENFGTFVDTFRTFSDILTKGNIVNILGGIAGFLMEIADAVPLLVPLGGIGVAAFAGFSLFRKFQMPSNINKMTKIFSQMSTDKDGFVTNANQKAPKIKGFFGKIGDAAKGAGDKVKTGFTKGLDVLKGIGPKLSTAASAVKGGMGKMISAVSGAMKSIGMLMISNPWMLLVAALVAAVVLIIMNWDKVLAALKWIWEWIKNNWPMLLAILTGPFGLAVMMIIKHWDTIKEALLAAWNWIKEQATAAWDTIKNIVVGAIEWVWHRLQDLWDIIVGVFNTAKDSVMTAINAVKDGIMSALEAIGGFFQGLWDKVIEVWDGIWNKISEVWGFIQECWNTVTETIGTIMEKFQDLWDKVIEVWDGIWSKIEEIGGYLGTFFTETIPGFFVGIWDGLTEGLASAINWVLDAVEDLANGAASAFNNTLIAGINLLNPWDDIPKVPELDLSSWKIEGFAKGGSFSGVALVGEHGAEMVYSNAQATVANHSDTMGLIKALGTMQQVGQATMMMNNKLDAIAQLEKAQSVQINQNFQQGADSRAIAVDLAWRLNKIASMVATTASMPRAS